jgi:peroxiredoxin
MSNRSSSLPVVLSVVIAAAFPGCLLTACGAPDSAPTDSAPTDSAPTDSAPTDDASDGGSSPGDSGSPGDTDTDPLVEMTPGDRVVHQARAPGPTFVEFTEVRWADDQVLACSPVLGLLHYDASDPAAPSGETALVVPDFSDEFPRCQRIAVQGDYAVVAAKADQIQPLPVVALLDIADPAAPRVLDSLVLADQIDGVAWFAGQPVVAAQEAGVVTLQIDGDLLSKSNRVEGLGNVRAVAAVGDLLVAGTLGGTVHFLDADLGLLGSVAVDGGVQAIAALPDGRIAVAMGSAGLALVSPPTGGAAAAVTGNVATRGTAVRMGVLGDGSVAVANWRDVRVYDTSGAAPALAAVEDMTAAENHPRTLAIDAHGDRIVVGEWSGLHLFHHDPTLHASEVYTDTRRVQLSPGAGRTARIQVANEGHLPLDVGAVETTQGWAAVGGGLVLEPGESASVDIEFVGEADVNYGWLTIHSDDPDEPRTHVEMIWGGSGLLPGDAAPSLVELGVNTGELHDILDAQGRVVVLSYFGTFCPVCSAGFPDLERQVAQAYSSDQVQVYGVNANLHPGEFDSVVLDFIEQTGVTFPVIFDQGGTYWMYDRPSDDTAPFPLNVVIDQDGRIAAVQVEQDIDALTATIDALLR